MSDRIEDLLDEVRLLWHVAIQAGEGLHARESITLGMRAILEFLLVNGAATVPGIARRRHVTRQHVQGLVNALLDLGLVTLGDNPAHRRSALVQLTAEGRRTIDRMRRRERQFFRQAHPGVAAGELERAVETLRAVRAALAGRAGGAAPAAVRRSHG